MVHSYPILALFDSSTSHCLYRVSITALHSDRPYHYTRNVNMKWIFRFRTSVRHSYGIFYLCYSRNDHDLSYQLHGARIFSEFIWSQVTIQKTIFKTLYGYYKLLIILFRVINIQHSELVIIGFLYLFVISLSGFLYLQYFGLHP